MAAGVPYGRRLSQLARQRGSATALVYATTDGGEHELSCLEIEQRANQMARRLAGAGVGPGALVVVGLRNSPEHVFCTFGAWKLGASVLPLRAGLPSWERDRLLAVAEPAAVVGDWDDAPPGTLTSDDVAASVSLDSSGIGGDHAPAHARLIASSGSTGTPKVIASSAPALYSEDDPMRPMAPDAVVMVASPLYHTNGFGICYPALLQGNRVVLMERFEAATAVDLIERHRVSFTVLVPTMLQRIAVLDGVRGRDFSSIENLLYGGAVLPEWVGRIWLELIPPKRFQIMYGGTEGVGSAVCTGEEWLTRPGTVGLPRGCDVMILDEDGNELGPDRIGEVWMRRHDPQQPFHYIGTETPTPVGDGYRTYGDMGWLDTDGFLYIADRRHDMIVTGGVNVFPAEVEAALSEHPEVADVVVIGLPDPEWGRRVHAIVEPAHPADPPTEHDLRAHCKQRLSGPKVPKTFEVAERLPRTSAGKINRSRLADERTGADAAEAAGSAGRG